MTTPTTFDIEMAAARLAETLLTAKREHWSGDPLERLRFHLPPEMIDLLRHLAPIPVTEPVPVKSSIYGVEIRKMTGPAIKEGGFMIEVVGGDFWWYRPAKKDDGTEVWRAIRLSIRRAKELA